MRSIKASVEGLAVLARGAGTAAIAAAVALALHGTVAAAAESPAADADAGGLEEIVVSAERRSTALQNTPISIQALSAESMEIKGVEDIADVALFTPNLSINGSRGNGNLAPAFTIRGISGGGGATSERGVALYIDDIYVPRTAGSVFKVFDLERVEVLRGPQGTNFGRNSEGGAIRLITKQPTHEFEAYAKATVGNFDHLDIIGMVNLPVSDAVAVRLQGARLNEDGYVRRGPELLGGSEDWLGRAQVLWDISDTLRLNVNGLYSKSESNGTPNVVRNWDMSPGINGTPDVPAAAAIQGNYADWVSDFLQSSGQARLATVNDPRIVAGDYTAPGFCFLDDANPDWDDACKQFDDNKYWQVDAKLTWNATDATSVAFTAGYSKLDHSGITDQVFLGVENRPDLVQSEVVNGEVLLNTEFFNGAVDLVAGLNLFQEESASQALNVSARGTSVYNQATGGAANGNGYAGLYGVANQGIEQTSRSAGLFSSATWHITQQLNFTGGLRVSYEEKEIDYDRRAGFGPAPTFPGMPVANDFVPSYAGAAGATSTQVNGSHNWTVVDWRATVDYHFTDDIMAYATASKAFKAGQYAYTVTATLSPAAQSSIIRPIDPEKVVNLESGLRTSWFDNRLRINPTGFWMAWTNRQSAQQQQCTAGDPSCPAGFRIITVNSGDVDVYGLELDAQLAITRSLVLDGAFGATHYRLKDPVANRGPYLFPEQPTPSWNMGLTYTTPQTRVGEFGFNVNYTYRGAVQTYPGSLTDPIGTADSSYELPSYGLFNARLQLKLPNEKTHISLYANNLADKVYGTYATRFGGGFWDSGANAQRGAPPRSALTWVMGRPREIGVTVQHWF